MSKYNNKYRIESVRLKDWDYSKPWYYYVTINTKDHVECYGKVENDEMILNELGKIAEDEWLKTKVIRKNVDLDYYVIMPNHVHGIVIINDACKTVARNGFTENENKYSQISPKANSLSAIIRSFKSAVTKRARENGYNNFSWQPRFYDRIIRNEKELYQIRKYIQQNPLKWDFEKSKPENIEL